MAGKYSVSCFATRVRFEAGDEKVVVFEGISDNNDVEDEAVGGIYVKGAVDEGGGVDGTKVGGSDGNVSADRR